jgi:hypothetical protein
MLLLSNFIVIAVLTGKLVPETVTTVPVAPEVGESVIAVVTTLNVAEAVNVPSVAVIVRLPTAAVLGIVIVAENVPVLDDVTVVGVVVIMLLSNFMVIVLLASKLEPDTVTVVPVIPLVGDRVIDAAGAVTVNGLATGLEPSSTVIL